MKSAKKAKRWADADSVATLKAKGPEAVKEADSLAKKQKEALAELLKNDKEKAKADQRSLNNYIEMVLKRDVGNIPNASTIEAIEEAQDRSKLERVDDIDSFFDNF